MNRQGAERPYTARAHCVIFSRGCIRPECLHISLSRSFSAGLSVPPFAQELNSFAFPLSLFSLVMRDNCHTMPTRRSKKRSAAHSTHVRIISTLAQTKWAFIFHRQQVLFWQRRQNKETLKSTRKSHAGICFLSESTQSRCNVGVRARTLTDAPLDQCFFMRVPSRV